jgi:N4-(beta-N-acetylglucosaminyl)-L-asparaginase
MQIGAVGGIRNIRDAAAAAALVKDHTHHTVLVGEQAAAFAVAMGLPYSSLTTSHSAAIYRNWLQQECQPSFWRDVAPDPCEACGPYARASDSGSTTISAQGLRKPRPLRRCNQPGSVHSHDTIAMLAMDASSHIAAGTSTNGICGKVAGRVGDAAIPGAGAYAVTSVGACGATGDGDLMMRFLPCYQVCRAQRGHVFLSQLWTAQQRARFSAARWLRARVRAGPGNASRLARSAAMPAASGCMLSR